MDEETLGYYHSLDDLIRDFTPSELTADLDSLRQQITNEAVLGRRHIFIKSLDLGSNAFLCVDEKSGMPYSVTVRTFYQVQPVDHILSRQWESCTLQLDSTKTYGSLLDTDILEDMMVTFDNWFEDKLDVDPNVKGDMFTGTPPPTTSQKQSTIKLIGFMDPGTVVKCIRALRKTTAGTKAGQLSQAR